MVFDVVKVKFEVTIKLYGLTIKLNSNAISEIFRQKSAYRLNLEIFKLIILKLIS